MTLIFGIFSTIYIDTACSSLVEELNVVIGLILKKNNSLVAEKMQNVIDDFEKKRPFLNIFVGQGETSEIRGDLNKAIFFINAQNFESSILYLQECKMDINRVITRNMPSISTIL